MSDAQILDRGYRSFDGDRRGVPGAVRSLILASIQRALGLRRAFRHKIVPLLSAAMAFVPAIVFVGLAALFPGDIAGELAPEYADYYRFVTAAIILFVAFVAPEVLCTDRRTGMLGLYLASPLTRLTYLLSKIAGVLAVLLIVTLGPLLLLLIGYTLVELGPDSFTGWIEIFARIVASGVLVALFFTAISMAAASFTDRPAFAAAGIIIAVLASPIMVGALVDLAELSPWLRMLDIFNVPFDAVAHIYGEPDRASDIPRTGAFVGVAGWIAASGALLFLRYRAIAVAK